MIWAAATVALVAWCVFWLWWLGHPRTCHLCGGPYRLGQLGEHFESPECKAACEKLTHWERMERLGRW